ncbi:cyclin-dependent kinase G-2 isoform X1 [Tanacetum coccineum]|uniref:cyclin-dependent kinase n=1 Tax=Tanacetum coccineum TaxID=301880 RepID=A0ABQ5AK63_9ASTR
MLPNSKSNTSSTSCLLAQAPSCQLPTYSSPLTNPPRNLRPRLVSVQDVRVTAGSPQKHKAIDLRGRHGGYRDNEFKERENDRDYIRNGNNQGKNRVRDTRGGPGGGRGRQRDVREREVVNGGAGGRDSGDRRPRVGDREPGELSSESGSDRDESENNIKSNEVYKTENDSHSESLNSKKRKFTPIVWDRDDKDKVNVGNIALPPPPVLPKSYRVSPKVVNVESNEVYSVHQETSNVSIEIEKYDKESYEIEPPGGASSSYVHEERLGLSFSSVQEERVEYSQDAGRPEDEDYMPERTIRSSRWANDANLSDEGEFNDAPVDNRRKEPIRRSVEVRSQNQSSSSEGRLSESDEDGYRVRSTSRDNYPENDLEKDYMDIDDGRRKYGNSRSQSESDSEDQDDSQGTPEPPGPPQRSVNMLQGCRSVDEFERLNKIDEGTYGVVYRAKDKKTGEVVALKKVKMEKEREGFPLTSLREINILLSFHHPSIVDVKEVVVGSNLDSIFMVMEYMEHDLKALMETMKQPFSQSEVKCLMLQLFEGTKYLHENWVLHRDLKTSNLLLNNRGELKICDFGLSRQYGSPLKPYTQLVVTLWYRAPELLLGAKQYSTAIDMWSLGCIMAELLSKQPLFNGKTEFDQIDKIFKILGTPNETIWPGYSKLPGVKVNFVKHQYNLLRRKFPATSFTGSPVLSDAGFDLLNKLLTYDPEKRITADAALNHEWFREVPLPKSKDFMPTFPAQHAQDRRTRRVMKSPDPLEEQRRKELQHAEFGTGGIFG